ncbi:uncharacterized protein Z518_04773 [Rhinocladiella mackenziei CBS 650.93]|uniref:WW domain-containing protein n=1 Tax=Rhinocladiella mackenziei CBS 650.93 TaxID=1442369 RepID=A0A0D2FWW5_9EURO|nr:uncharacterized protein Z518_04773 [Rhinocladiella mackenziei CBS 650.93]KIX06797.1 hypothetical protein Z518_04773 [Rhinocladiella mackenziei CBS 650.93]
MSFFKKLKDELKEMLNDGDDGGKQKKEEEVHASDQTRDFHNQPPNVNDQRDPYGQPQQLYPQYGYSPPPPSGYDLPPSSPQLPPGWISQWEPNTQRHYYLEQTTGRTQYEPPSWGGAPSSGGLGFHQNYGGAMPAAPPMGGHGEHTRVYYGAPGHGHEENQGSGIGNMVVAGVGGAALGVLAANVLSDGDSHPAAATAPAGNGALPPAAPTEPPLEYNPELSSSQRSSLQEGREDLEEAKAEVAEESDPSSSDIEELQEAQEEYASEVESAHEELEE